MADMLAGISSFGAQDAGRAETTEAMTSLAPEVGPGMAREDLGEDLWRCHLEYGDIIFMAFFLLAYCIFLANQLNGHLPMTIYADVLRNTYGDVINGTLMAY